MRRSGGRGTAAPGLSTIAMFHRSDAAAMHMPDEAGMRVYTSEIPLISLSMTRE